MNNKLIIAAAGSGKTTLLVNEAISRNPDHILITTFTEANEREIRNRIISIKGYMPSNIIVQTWFSFLLQHGVRPFQSAMNDEIHCADIGFYLTSKKSGQKLDASGNPIIFKRKPIYWGEKDFIKHYFTNSFKIYSDKISKFVCSTDKVTKGAVISRVSRLFKHIYIDEVQDLAGYDLDIIKLLFKSDSSVTLVGDPRQVTYLTHHSTKYGKYSDGNIKTFVENELGKRISCEIDTTTLAASHRNNQKICDYSGKLYPSLPSPNSCNCDTCKLDIEHSGVYIIKPSLVEVYLKKYNPLQLRWSSSTKTNPNYEVQNFGESKGLTADRVLIYPTETMKEWIKNNNHKLKNEVRAKLYVGITRARASSTIIMDYDESDQFDGIEIYTGG